MQRLAGVRRRERNARRWRLWFPAFLQGDWTLACPVLLRDPRRNQVAPGNSGFGEDPGCRTLALRFLTQLQIQPYHLRCVLRAEIP